MLGMTDKKLINKKNNILLIKISTNTKNDLLFDSDSAFYEPPRQKYPHYIIKITPKSFFFFA